MLKTRNQGFLPNNESFEKDKSQALSTISLQKDTIPSAESSTFFKNRAVKKLRISRHLNDNQFPTLTTRTDHKAFSGVRNSDLTLNIQDQSTLPIMSRSLQSRRSVNSRIKTLTTSRFPDTSEKAGNRTTRHMIKTCYNYNKNELSRLSHNTLVSGASAIVKQKCGEQRLPAS